MYCSDFISDDEATQFLLANLEGPALASPNKLRFKTGRRRLFWNKNVVAIGLSAGFLEPLESTSIHLIQEGITELIQLFPDKGFAQSDADEYNRRMGVNFERVRDFLLLHYVATQRDDSPMWLHFRNLALPESLQEKIDAWTTRGFIIKYEFGVFLPPSWIAVMLGQNLRPRGYDPRADAAPKEMLVKNAAAILQGVRTAAQNAPDHAAYHPPDRRRVRYRAAGRRSRRVNEPRVKTPIERIVVCGGGLAAHTDRGGARAPVAADDSDHLGQRRGLARRGSVFRRRRPAFRVCLQSRGRGLRAAPDRGHRYGFFLGHAFSGLGRGQRSWVQCFHLPLPIVGGVLFHHHLWRLGISELEPFLMPAIAARRGCIRTSGRARAPSSSRARSTATSSILILIERRSRRRPRHCGSRS